MKCHCIIFGNERGEIKMLCHMFVDLSSYLCARSDSGTMIAQR